jgi:glycosyltransferase involved in cell wall biosynthesis
VVGNNRKMKGIVYLAKAFAQIPHDLPVHLLLIGRDMNNAEINQALHGRSNVHFLGFRKDVLHIVAACQVFVLPSIFGESITKSVIEAMSLGIAPIITDIEGNVELVENGQSGFVVPAKNSDALSQAMLELYQNPEKLKMMGEAAKRRITTHLNIQQTIIATKKLYDELMLSK